MFTICVMVILHERTHIPCSRSPHIWTSVRSINRSVSMESFSHSNCGELTRLGPGCGHMSGNLPCPSRRVWSSSEINGMCETRQHILRSKVGTYPIGVLHCSVKISPSGSDIGGPATNLFCNRSGPALTHHVCLCCGNTHQPTT